MPMLRKLRLAAAVVLICTIFLPLSECSQGPNHPQVVQKSFAQVLHPQSNADFSYQYGYHSLEFSLMGLLTLIAFVWPLALLLVVRRSFGPRMKWTVRIVELLLCAGTIYWLDVISYRSFGATWLYGEYVGLCAVTAFALLGIAAWFRDRQVSPLNGGFIQNAPV